MWNNSGMITNVAYRINTTNSQGYRFGNRTYINTAYYYAFTLAGLKLKPNIGINYQSNKINTYNGDDVIDSNGYTLNATTGINVLHKKVGVNMIAFLPVSQNNFDGQTKLAAGFLAGMTYSF